MIESVERLKKFVDMWSSTGVGCSIIARADTATITLSDLKEALSLIPPYAPGEEIEVSEYIEFANKVSGKFIGFHSNGKVVVELESGGISKWSFHRPIPKTVDLKGFPVDAVEQAKVILERQAQKEEYYLKETISICQAIVASARKE